MTWRKAFGAAVAFLLVASLGSAHPGRTDSSGGHHDRKNGGYHYHGGGASSSPPPIAFVPAPSPPVLPAYVEDNVRTKARTEPRVSVRTTPRTPSMLTRTTKLIDAKPVDQIKPNFAIVFHGGRRLEILNFSEEPDEFEVVATHGGKASYPRKIVDRIEAILGEREWTDATGKFRILATFVSIVGGDVNLRKPSDEIITVPLDRLSDLDQKYVEHATK